MALIYFAVTLFVSAFLLFLVQPMIGKMILPRLGGTPQVWNTCMMFFQIMLLAGYFYTHTVTSKLPLKKQLITHSLFLLLPLPVLLAFGQPFYVAGFGAEGGGNPIFVTLGLLLVIVGLPFLVVSTTAPLLQRWFNHTGHPAAKDPYFLYGASNLGSILGLILYPVTVEYFLGLEAQAWFWLCGYVVLAGLVGGCALTVFKAPPTVQLPIHVPAGEINPEFSPAVGPGPDEPAPIPEPTTAVTASPPAPTSVSRVASGIKRGGKQRGRGARVQPMPVAVKGAPINIKKVAHEEVEEEKPFEMTGLRRLRWVGLAAVPTSLMLGCTTYISTDISPIPLLWIIPLTLYLLSFVMVFSRWSVPWVGLMAGLAGVLVVKVFESLFGLTLPTLVPFGLGAVVWVVFTIVNFRKQMPWLGDGRHPRAMTPHKVMVILQIVAFPLLMLVFIRGGYSEPVKAMAICWGAFFVTALVCHGELARDRPPAQFLTEFYLWMSVGGMVGGTFNALFAPVVPWFGLFEFPLAIVFAALVRPSQKGQSWTDQMLGAYQSPNSDSISIGLDFLLPILLLGLSYFLMAHALDRNSWGIDTAGLANPNMYKKELQARVAEENLEHPLFKLGYKTIGLSASLAFYFAQGMFYLITYLGVIGCALLAWKRPVRMALGLGAVFLASAIYEGLHDERVLFRDRSYFGILRVVEDRRSYKSPDGKETIPFAVSTSLTHGTTLHGLNYSIPDGTTSIPDGGKMKLLPDLTRLATTYYHRDGPVGAVMEQLNWFPGMKSETKDERVTYWADARLPVSVIGSGAPGLGVNLPLAQIVSAWSEPPYATIGLGTGTMASYSRPYQHMTFYEIDEHIRDFSLPPEDRKTYFTYLQGSIKRGTKLEVIMGDARLTMTKEKPNEHGTYYPKDGKFPVDRKAPLAWDTYTSYAKRESYYRAIEVDAFSSDAIPVHLITKQAIELYMDKLMPNGVLLVHTSNRHVNLVRPVLKICEDVSLNNYNAPRDADGNWTKMSTKLAWVICKDDDKERGFNIENPCKNGHSGSEYVLVAREQKYLPPYAWTPEQERTWADMGIYFPVDNITKKQFDALKDKRVEEKKTAPKMIESTITFLTPSLVTESRYADTVEYYGYNLPPGTRTWTDDYSNVLSVFRWR